MSLNNNRKNIAPMERQSILLANHLTQLFQNQRTLFICMGCSVNGFPYQFGSYYRFSSQIHPAASHLSCREQIGISTHLSASLLGEIFFDSDYAS